MKMIRLMSYSKWILALSIACGLALTASAQDYYPTEIGNTWVLLSADGSEQLTYSIEESDDPADEGIIILRILTETLGTDTVDDDVYYISDDAGDLKLHRTKVDEGAFGIAKAILDPPGLFFPAALPLGRTWDILTVTDLELVGTATTTSTIKVVAIEDVETPIGTFEDCVKLEIYRRSVTRLGTVPSIYYQWLAPDVGPIKFQNDQEILFELQSYNLVDATPSEPDTDTDTPADTDTDTPADTDTDTPTEISSFDVKLDAGLNLISIPLMPAESHTAKSLAEKLGATVVIKLDAATQRFIGYSAAEEGDGFDIDGSKGYIVNTPDGGDFTFTGTAWMNESDGESAAPKLSTAKNAWAFLITSNLQNLDKGTSYTLVAKNLRTGVVATEKVVNDTKGVSAVWANMNRKSVVKVGDKIDVTLLDKQGAIVAGPFQHTVSAADIHNAYLNVQIRVGDVRPRKTLLAQNFPNPFNPETWIPYQLMRGTDVTIRIYDVSGHSVRTLNLGYKSVGSYMTAATAAYWDGKNEAGEPVASGIFFYTLQTENFSATRKMVILK